MAKIKQNIIILLILSSLGLHAQQLILGSERMEEIINSIDNKNLAIVGNQTSLVNDIHLVDTLLSLKQNIVSVFSPEHGFRGTEDAGAKIDNEYDSKTGLPIISLYGKNKKPTREQLEGIDIIIFDIQDVGARFYTYISTLHYVMEAAGENNIKVIVLDRPNPNGHYFDGPILEKEFKSFVNVIEDARIDKLIQKKYPGLTDDYLKGFDKMYKDNFFGTKDRDLSSYALIDKINLRAWQRSVGYVPQHIYLADDTIASNIAFGVDPKYIDQKNEMIEVLYSFAKKI